MFVTTAVVNIWTGIKQVGNDSVGQYTRLTGCAFRRDTSRRSAAGVRCHACLPRSLRPESGVDPDDLKT